MELFLSQALINLKQSQPLGLVLGNESADLDSVVSSIAGAYLFHKVKKATFVPILNLCGLEELSLRGEVVHWLKENGLCRTVDPKSVNVTTTFHQLPCLPDALNVIQGLTNKDYSYNVILVDHQGTDYPEELQSIYSHVTDIIDHHEPFHNSLEDDIDNVLEMNGKNYMVKRVGSCATLIAEMYHKHWSTLQNLCAEDIQHGPMTALYLLYGAILLDTGCCEPNNGRTTAKDVAMIHWIEETLTGASKERLHFDRTAIYRALSNAKTNISGFSVWQLLHKDLKFIRQNSVSLVALPSIVGLDASELLLKPDCLEGFRRLAMASNPSLRYVIANVLGVPPGDTKARRCIILYPFTADERSTNELISYLLYDKKSVDSLCLSRCENMNDLENVHVFHVNNQKATRKQLLPVVEKFFSSTSS